MRRLLRPASPLCLDAQSCLCLGRLGSSPPPGGRRPGGPHPGLLRRGRRRTAGCSSARSAALRHLVGDGPLERDHAASGARARRGGGHQAVRQRPSSPPRWRQHPDRDRRRHRGHRRGQHVGLRPGQRRRRRPARLRAARRPRRRRRPRPRGRTTPTCATCQAKYAEVVGEARPSPTSGSGGPGSDVSCDPRDRAARRPAERGRPGAPPRTRSPSSNGRCAPGTAGSRRPASSTPRGCPDGRRCRGDGRRAAPAGSRSPAWCSTTRPGPGAGGAGRRGRRRGAWPPTPSARATRAPPPTRRCAARSTSSRRPGGRRVTTVTVAAAFGCPFEGEVPRSPRRGAWRRVVDLGADEVALADTIGVAVPAQVTPGSLGLASLAAPAAPAAAPARHPAHRRGQRRRRRRGGACATLDASIGGTGGCPFAPNATGNVATEDLVYLFERMGVPTGLDLAAP